MTLRFPVALCALMTLACAAGPDTGKAPEGTDQDVRGVYAITWSDEFTVRLDIGGAVQETTAGEDDVVTFNAPDGTPLELDLAAWCADPAVTCPSEAWAGRIALDEDEPTVVRDQHILRAWDADVPGTVVSGWVDHPTDDFVLGLDGDSGGDSSCGALSLSLAGGTFAYAAADTGADPYAEVLAGGVANGAGPIGIVDGQVALGWLGVCAWSGLAVAATISIETDFTAIREGDLPA